MKLPFLVLTALSVAPLAALADTSLVCERELQPGDIHEFRCPLEHFASSQRFHFAVKLSGGHDDSSSSLAIQHEGKAIPCEKDSKTASEGEDGEITLDCRFALPAASLLTPSTLLPTLKASHVFYESYSLKHD
jgi:hypothetical protein